MDEIAVERIAGWIGLDVGKQDHHASVLSATGELLFERSVGNDEQAIERLLDRCQEIGSCALVIDQPGSIGSLAVCLRVHDDRLYGMWLLYATTGLRRGEALGLKWSQLDLERGQAAISEARVTAGYAVRESTPKTDRGRRSVALDPATVAALREHRKRQVSEQLAYGAGYVQTGGLVFVQEDGRPLHPDRVSKVFGTHVSALGGTRITLHGLRHTWASLALQAGVNPKVVSERLGHATVSFTLDTYSHVMPGMQEDAAAAVAALVLGA